MKKKNAEITPLDLAYPIIGVDEVGRGCLAGPVMAGAVLLPQNPSSSLTQLTDSKKLSEKKRLYFAEKIYEEALSFGIGYSWQKEIDSYNILQATFLAMTRACQALYYRAKKKNLSFPTVDIDRIPLAIDGNMPISSSIWLKLTKQVAPPQTSYIRGDLHVMAIGAASIIAKTSRDALMVRLAKVYPNYCLEKHKGYGTAQHLKALALHGASSLHRKSFAGVFEKK